MCDKKIDLRDYAIGAEENASMKINIQNKEPKTPSIPVTNPAIAMPLPPSLFFILRDAKTIAIIPTIKEKNQIRDVKREIIPKTIAAILLPLLDTSFFM